MYGYSDAKKMKMIGIYRYVIKQNKHHNVILMIMTFGAIFNMFTTIFIDNSIYRV